MIKVIEKDIDFTIPDSGIGIVFMQPYFDLTENEPYRIINSQRDKQLEKIVKTLEIAKKKDHHCEKTHFTLFPEYAIPGLDGINKVQEMIEDTAWECGTLVIGGVDALSKDDYQILCANGDTCVDEENQPDKVGRGKWINCAVIWMKTIDKYGSPSVKRWVQPKLCPSWPEEDITVRYMFEGQCITIFKGKWTNQTPFRFFSVICYDWIAPFGEQKGISAIMNEINSMWNTGEDPKHIHMLFVPQRNEKPNHFTFLKSANDYFQGIYPSVDRSKSVVLFFNSAGGIHPGPYDKYGYSSLVFCPSSLFDMVGAPPSYAVCTDGLRNPTTLQPCKDALFRENGECITSLKLFHPNFVDGIPRRNKPVLPAMVHPVSDEYSDPRTPGQQVPAIVKWLNDILDQNPDFDSSLGALQTPCNEEKARIISDLRWLEEKDLHRLIEYGKVNTDGNTQEIIDYWAEKEKAVLDDIVTSLTFLSTINEVKVTNAKAHGWMVNDKTVVDIIVVTGGTHSENIRHASECFTVQRERVLLIVSHDQAGRSLMGIEKSITDTDPAIRRCSFDVFQRCLGAETKEEFRSRLLEVTGITQ